MLSSQKLAPGAAMPEISLPGVGGGEVALGGAGWKLVVVYRGAHCPLCRTYLKTLDGLLEDFAAAGVAVAVVSGDPLERAEAEAAEEGWRFPVGAELSPAQMRELGLYISEPRSPQETDRPFPEPGLFVANPEGNVQIVDVSNAPFARPDLNGVLRGLKFIIEKGYPIRGMAA